MTVSEKKSLKRAKIIDAAYKLFTDKSINSTAIDDVVNAAGIAKGTFYLYFSDKYDLLDQLILTKLTDIVLETLIKLDCTVPESADAGEKVIFFANALIDRFSERKELLALIDKNRSLTLRLIMNSENEQINSAIEKLISDFKPEGASEREALNAFYVLADMIIAVCCDSILYERPCGIDEMKPLLFMLVRRFIWKREII